MFGAQSIRRGASWHFIIQELKFMEEDHDPMQARILMAQTLQIMLSRKQPKNQEELGAKGTWNQSRKRKPCGFMTSCWNKDYRCYAFFFSALLCIYLHILVSFHHHPPHKPLCYYVRCKCIGGGTFKFFVFKLREIKGICDWNRRQKFPRDGEWLVRLFFSPLWE